MRSNQHDATLISRVHPADWIPPQPEQMYNLVVVGAGTAGLISAIGCAALGGKVALVEKYLMGGDCLNAGCVPSKSLLRSCRAAAEIRSADRFGLTPHAIDRTDFPAVMDRLRRIRAAIAFNDSARRYSEMGIHLFFGEASFRDRGSIALGDTLLRFRKAVIATGSSPVHPEIPGLEEAGCLTNETVFDLVELPPRLAVIGGGPVGCELAQAFRRLGSEVTIVQRRRLLPGADEDASGIIEKTFRSEGIRILTHSEPLRVERTGSAKCIFVSTPNGTATIESDEILIGAGRRPNVENLSLPSAGVHFDTGGIQVDDFLRTTNPRIYAAGDVCMKWKFTHAADAAARIAVQNALFLGRKRKSALLIPWCIYTDPEIAQVGLNEREAESRNAEIDVYKIPMREIDRAAIDGETEGYVKIVAKKRTDRILGATIAAAHAGEIISEISVAMAAGAGLKTLADVIHPYPTRAEGVRRAAAAYNLTRLTPRVSKFLGWWLRFQRNRGKW